MQGKTKRRKVLKSTAVTAGVGILGTGLTAASKGAETTKFVGVTYDPNGGRVTGDADGTINRNPNRLTGTLRLNETAVLKGSPTLQINQSAYDKSPISATGLPDDGRKISQFASSYGGEHAIENKDLQLNVTSLENENLLGRIEYPSSFGATQHLLLDSVPKGGSEEAVREDVRTHIEGCI